MEQSLVIKVFLASPGDVSEERKFVSETILKINSNEGRIFSPRFYLDLYCWEKDLIPGWQSPQENINLQLKPDEADIFIGILWSRFGTPTTNSESGTEEEFNLALNHRKKSGETPHLLFYRCTRDIPYNADTEQIKKVKTFFDSNKETFTYSKYKKIEKFKDLIYGHLKRVSIEIVKKQSESVAQRNVRLDFDDLRNIGITHFYTPDKNEERNKDKINFLGSEDGDIYLLAHTGNSYLNPGSHYPATDEEQGRFFSHILNRLINKNNKMQIVLLNPYSLEARKVFFAENFHKLLNTISDISLKSLENGKNCKRVSKCIEGAEIIQNELRKRGLPDNKLEIRISNTATDGTILMSENRLFFEPYLCARFLDRLRRGLNIFEVQVRNLLNNACSTRIYGYDHLCGECPSKSKCENNLYKTLSEQFLLLWHTSIPLNEYKTQIHKYKEDFEKYHKGLFENQIVQLHDSWFAFDPIIGCKGRCSYCFLSPQGWENTTPRFRIPFEGITPQIEHVYPNILNNPFFKQSQSTQGVYSNMIAKVPIAIGNKTDMFESENINFLKQFLSHHIKTQKNRPIVLITKQCIPIDLIKEIACASCSIYIFNSISFLDKEFEPNVPYFLDRLKAAKDAKDYIKKNGISNISLVHYWRPITDINMNLDLEENISTYINKVKGIFDCSIAIGLKITPEMYQSIRSRKKHPMHNYIMQKIKFDRENIEVEGVELFFPPAIELVKLAKLLKYNLYLHTSCAISSLQNKGDYNGSMWRDDICQNSYCPPEQTERCQSFKKNWSLNENIKSIALSLRISENQIINHEDCIEIIGESITQEELTFLTHIIGKPVFSKTVRLSLVWPSGNQKYFWRKYGKQTSL